MAKNQMQIQKMAFKQKAAKASDKLDKAVFGMGYGGMTMANGGYVAGKGGYGGYKMADGGPVGGLLGNAITAIHNRPDQIEAAIAPAAPAAPVARGPAPALRPATPENPRDVLRAEANKIAARNAAAAATPAPAPSLLERAKARLGLASGGPVVGPGGPTEDKVPAMLSHGEYVMPADTVKAVGKENLDIIRHATHKPVNKARFGMAMANGGSLEEAVRNFAAPAVTAAQSAMRKIPGFADTTDYNATPGLRKGMDEALAEDNPYDVVATPAAIMPGAVKSLATAAPSIYQAGRAGASRAISAAGDALAAAPGRIRSMFGRAAPVAAGEAAAPAAAVPGVGPALPRNPNPVNANMRNGASSPEATAYRESVGAAAPAAAAAEAPAARAAAGRIAVAGSVPAAVAASQFGTPGSAQGAESQAPSTTSSAPGAPNSALAGFYNDNPDVRRAVVQANRPDTDQHDLGDYGAAGSQMFGRASTAGGKMDTFSGKGSGAHVPDSGLGSGVLTPAQVEADRQLNIARAGAAQTAHNAGGFGSGPQLATDSPAAAQAGTTDQFGYPAAPNYQVSPEAERARSQIADLSNQLATLKPGDMGRKRLAGQIASLTAAASDLSAADERKNTFGMTKYSHQVQQIQNERMLANQAIGYGVQQQGNEYNYDAKMAEVRNSSHKQAMDEKQQRYSNELPQLEALGGGDKDLANQIKVAAGTRLFPTSDGKFVPISELQGKDKARAYGVFQKDIDAAKALKAKDLPYSLSGEDVDKPATGLGFAHALVTDPINTIKFGTTETNGNFRTGRANVLPTHEAHAARKASFGTAN